MRAGPSAAGRRWERPASPWVSASPQTLTKDLHVPWSSAAFVRVVRTGGISDPRCQRQLRHRGISDPRVDVLIDHDVGWFLTLLHTTVGARRFYRGSGHAGVDDGR